jgi:hypothetical protein
VRGARATLLEDDPSRRRGGIEGLARDRPVGPGVQIRNALEDRELGAQGGDARRPGRTRRAATADAGEGERVAHARLRAPLVAADDDQRRQPELDRVAGLELALEDPAAVDEGPVRRAEVLDAKAAVRSPGDARVPA